jgi:hypothetical protein
MRQAFRGDSSLAALQGRAISSMRRAPPLATSTDCPYADLTFYRVSALGTEKSGAPVIKLARALLGIGVVAGHL